jgi:hypothetical protein
MMFVTCPRFAISSVAHRQLHVAVDWWTVAVHYLGDLAIMAFRGNWFASEIQIISTFVPSVHYTTATVHQSTATCIIQGVLVMLIYIESRGVA